MASKVKIIIESGRHLPGEKKPDHGMVVAWAELNGTPISGVLAAHDNREVAEYQAAQELARRLRRLLSGRPVAGSAPEDAEPDAATGS